MDLFSIAVHMDKVHMFLSLLLILVPEVARPNKPLMLKAEMMTAGQNGVTC